MFSALRQGNPFYILEKGQDIKLKVGQVESISQPQPKYKTPDINNAFGMNMQMVVDITVIVDGQKMEFNQVPGNLSIADFGGTGVVISESKDSILSEVDGILQTSRQILNNIDYHKSVCNSCEDILKQLNPSFAKEKEHDAAIQDLTSQLGTIKNEFSSVKNDLSRILGFLANAEQPKTTTL